MVRAHPALSARLMTLALAVASAVACGDDAIAGPGATELDRAESRWNRSGIGARNYTMHQQRSCFCIDGGTMYEITVTGGVITRVAHATTGVALPGEQFARFRTVPALFAEVRAAMTREGVLQEVEYEPVLGYPTTVGLDPIPAAADDETWYFTRNVIPKP